MKIEGANYKAIYTDLILKKFPEKMEICQPLLKKKTLSTLDAIKINQILFPQSSLDVERSNQRHKSYKEKDIKEILKYQEDNCLNITQLALKFKLSRNTVAKWRKKYL